jgi:hypothetical protein
MIQDNHKDIKDDSNPDEISVREIALKLKEWWSYILSKWIIILVATIVGGSIGLFYSLQLKPIYKAAVNFVLQDEKSGGGMSSALGLASQFGIDLGGGAGGEFSSDNLLELMKSRSIVEKALLTCVTINGRSQTLVEHYISFKGFRKQWQNQPEEMIRFLPGEDRAKFTLIQNSVLNRIHKSLISNELSVDKLDKKSSIISLKVNSTNELFSKYFAEALTEVVSDFYIQTKIKKGSKNVAILEHQVDSVRSQLYSAIAGAAMSIDATPNPNPLVQSLKVPSQRRTVDITANTAILSELVKQLVISKTSVLQETPLLQIIDRPVLPLESQKLGKLKGIVIGGFISGLLTVLSIIVFRIFKTIML